MRDREVSLQVSAARSAQKDRLDVERGQANATDGDAVPSLQLFRGVRRVNRDAVIAAGSTMLAMVPTSSTNPVNMMTSKSGLPGSRGFRDLGVFGTWQRA